MELAELLLTHGADPSRQNAEGLTVRDMALRRGFVDLADLINDHAQPR
jgi:ankyrin repeat protein